MVAGHDCDSAPAPAPGVHQLTDDRTDHSGEGRVVRLMTPDRARLQSRRWGSVGAMERVARGWSLYGEGFTQQASK